MYSVYLNPFPNKPWFLRVCSTSLVKTLSKKEKLLVSPFPTVFSNDNVEPSAKL